MSSTVPSAEAEQVESRVSPYQGLTYYSVEDSAYFFGRESERRIIAANLRSSRLTLLYGPTGVGKSSLLRAGVQRDLLALARKNLVARGSPEFAVAVFSGPWHGDALVALDACLRAAIEPLVDVAVPEPPSPMPPLGERLESLAHLLEGELLIVLDQFEEYFLYHGEESGEGTFDRGFPLAVTSPDLNVSFLISIREDALSQLDRFKGRVPGLFDNYLRIDHLDSKAARRAIEEPVNQFNVEHRVGLAPITVQPTLVDAVLDQVRAGRVVVGQTGRGASHADGAGSDAERRIEAPHLQLVMEKLWEEEMREGSTELRLATLERLGGSEQIVLARGREVLDSLPADEQDRLAAIFDRLVTPSGSKVACAAADLAKWAKLPEAALTPTLEKLCRGEARILRPIDPPPGATGGKRYEIFHDVLASAILDWQARYEHQRAERELTARLAVEELKRQKAQQQAKRDRRIAFRSRVLAAVAGLFLIVAIVIGVVVVIAKRDAETQRRDARAQQLAASAAAALPLDPHVSLFLAREAINLRHTLVAESALRSALAEDRVKSVAVLRPPGSIRDASLDSTGSRAVTVGQSGVQVWDVARKKLLATLDPVPPITDARLSRDGKLLATASQQGPIELWDVGSRRRLVGFRVSRDAPSATNSVSFSPNGRLLLTTHSDGSARLWRDGNLLTRISSASSGFLDAEFWPDGRRIVTASDDNTAQIRDAGSGAVLRVLRGHLGPVRRAAFSRDGKYVVTASDDATARVWDAATGESLAQLIGHTGPVRDASFSPGGKFVVTAGDTTARLWEPRQGRSLAVLRGHSDFVLSATFNKDGRRVVTTSSDGTVRVWNADPKVVVLSGHTDRVNGAAFNPDAGRVVTASDDRTLRIWQSSSSRGLRVLGTSKLVDPAGRRLPSSPFVDAVFSRDGDVVAGAGRKGAAIWDSRTGKLLGALPVVSDPFSAEHVTSVDLNPDGTRLVTGTTSRVSIWAVRPSLSGDAALSSHSNSVLDARYNEDGTRIVTAGKDKTVRILEAATLRQRRQIDGAAPFKAAAFSSDGTRIAAASADNTARIFDASDGRELFVLRGHGGAVNDVAFSPDGKLLVTASDDKSARVWDAHKGVLVAVLRGHTDAVRTAQFGPVGGNTIVTASRDGTARLYPRESFLPYGQLSEIADREAAVPLTSQEQRELDLLRRG